LVLEGDSIALGPGGAQVDHSNILQSMDLQPDSS